MGTLGDRLREERLAQGISVAELARRVAKAGLRIHPTTIQQLEVRSSVRSQAAVEIATALGVSTEWLINGKGPKGKSRSIDRLMAQLPAVESDLLYDEFAAVIELRLKRLKAYR